VDHVESGGAPLVSHASTAQRTENSASAAAQVSNFNPASLQNEDNVIARVIRNHQVDRTALTEIEQAGNAELTATAYYVAAKQEYAAGRRIEARNLLNRALYYKPDSPAILVGYAAVLVQMGNSAEAVPYAEHATRLAPDSADAFKILGFALFASDNSKDAVRAWKKSLSLRSDPVLEQYIAKANRELIVESDFSQNETGHFTLRYEGKNTPDALRREIQATLEAHYNDLSNQFGIAPRSSIPVVLYTDQAFFDVTLAPSWTAALNDGKLRIPIEGMNSVTPELSRVLRHELAHSFINYVSRGRCSHWLNEGIAQALEPRDLSRHGRRLAELFAAQSAVPYNELEGSFMQYSGSEAVLAYDESLAAVQYLVSTGNMDDMRRILERIGQGSSTEAALRTTVHLDYPQLQAEVAKYLKDKYGE
jgi:tetratricopeptide (TPR) repeat protein